MSSATNQTDSPVADQESTSADLEVQPGFRWRVIPAYLLICFGGLGLLLNTVLFAASLVGTVWGYFGPWNLAIKAAAGSILSIIGSVLWIAAGRLIISKRWGKMIVCLIAGYIILGTGAYIVKETGHLMDPPDPYTNILELPN